MFWENMSFVPKIGDFNLFKKRENRDLKNKFWKIKDFFLKM